MTKTVVGIALVGTVLMAAFLWGRSSRNADIASWRRLADSALSAGGAYRDSISASSQREAALHQRLARLQQELATLSSTADSLGQIADTSTEIGPVRVALGAERTAHAACRTTLATALDGWSNCRERAKLAEARAATLDSLLREGVRVTDCRMLGIRFFPRCTSRTVALGIGAVLGAVIVTQVKR